MHRRSSTLNELGADQPAATRGAVLHARAFIRGNARTLPTRALHQRHLSRRTRGRHRLAENLGRVTFESHHASTSNAGRLRSGESERCTLVLLASETTRGWHCAARNALARAAVGEDLAIVLGDALGLDATIGGSAARCAARTDTRVGHACSARSRCTGSPRGSASRPPGNRITSRPITRTAHANSGTAV